MKERDSLSFFKEEDEVHVHQSTCVVRIKLLISMMHDDDDGGGDIDQICKSIQLRTS